MAAAYMFDLDLNPASTLSHDAKLRDGRDMEMNLTQGTGVAIRHEPEHMIVLHHPKDGSVHVVFNGPGALAWNASGKKQKKASAQFRCRDCQSWMSAYLIACGCLYSARHPFKIQQFW